MTPQCAAKLVLVAGTIITAAVFAIRGILIATSTCDVMAGIAGVP